MKFQGAVIETYPNGVTLAVEVRVEAEDGDAARPVADAAMAALEARRLWQGVTRRVLPVAAVTSPTIKELLAEVDPLCVCGHPKSMHQPFGEGAMLACVAVGCACRPGCIHDGFVDACGVADDDGMRRDSRE
jgi:hypothetical protein